MADDTPMRRSGRKRESNRKYKDDVIEPVELAEQLEYSDEGDATPLRVLDADDSDDDEEFYSDQSINGPELSADEELSGAEASDDSSIATPAESEADELLYDDLSELDDTPKRKWKPKPVPTTHFRGISDRGVDASHTSEQCFVDRIIGTAREDQDYYARTRDTWANNVTLPYRRPDGPGSEGMSLPYQHTGDQRAMEATVGWDWYYVKGGQTWFQARQKVVALSAEEGVQYVANSTRNSGALLMGPYGRQKLFSIAPRKSLNLNEAWSKAQAAGQTNDEPAQTQTTSAARQEGWVFNVGSGVQSLAWAPNQLDTQYLAISTLPSNSHVRLQKPEFAPAYTPSPGPSSIQIWALPRSTLSVATASQRPDLRLLICTEWGYARQLKWCPVTRRSREEAKHCQVSLGLLAGLWADGYVRVLDVCLEERGDAGTQYVKYNTAAFASKPSNAMCTCVDWLSPTDIVVGCSNGYVALWNICPPRVRETPEKPASDILEPRPESGSSLPVEAASAASCIEPRPYVYVPIHSSYILAICSAYPTHPHLVATSSATGYLRMTDIRSPYSDYVMSQRSHWSPTVISYCAALSCFVTYEEGGAVKMFPIRRFWSSVSIAKREPEALSVAVGHLHPTVLAGFADGTLLAVNPVRCFINKRTRAILQQKVWKHEWARQKVGSIDQPTSNVVEHAESRRLEDVSDEPNNESQGSRDQAHQEQQNEHQHSSTSNSVSRFTEGYRTELPILQSLKPNIGRQRTRVATHAIYTTIYDEETGVRQVVWNPNEGWGGWTASGMGSGLVRVEDLALSTA